MDLPTLRPGAKDPIGEREADHWTVRHQPPTGGAGWRDVEGWEELEEPVDRQTFEWNEPDPQPGRYQLFAVKDKKLRRPAEDVRWSWIVEDDATDTQDVDPDMIADRAADRVLAALQSDGDLAPEERVARQKAVIQLALLNNEEFVAKHGEAIALSEFDVNQGDGLEFSEYEKNPVGAFLYDTYKDPQQMRELGSNLGAGGGAFFEGLVSGIENPESVFQEEIEAAEAAAESAGEDEEMKPSRAGEIRSLDDLTDRVDDDLADELAATQVAEGREERADDATTAGAGRAQAGETAGQAAAEGEPPPDAGADEARPGADARTAGDGSGATDPDETELDELSLGPPADEDRDAGVGVGLTRDDIRDVAEDLEG
jgi:hypothetical protein